MNRDAEPNKYVLEAVKLRDPDRAPFGVCQGSRDLFFTREAFGDGSIYP